MDDNKIDTIKDAATILKDSDPLLAYELFSLILRHRPNGPYIIKSHKKLRAELKLELGIKTFVVIGNCQVGVIANLIAEKSDNFEIDKVVAVHRFNGNKEDVYKAFDRCDYIIAQNIGSGFIGINTETIKERYPNKLVRVLNLHFTGFHPDWGYMPKLNNLRCQSPIGDYHNKTILNSFIEGCSEFEAITRYKDNEYNTCEYSDVAKSSLNILKKRELSVDIKMTDIIESDLSKGLCGFHTFNHPNKRLLNIEVNRLLDYLSLDYDKKQTSGDALDKIKLRINPIANNGVLNETMIFNKEININQFVKDSYDIYRNNIEAIRSYIK